VLGYTVYRTKTVKVWNNLSRSKLFLVPIVNILRIIVYGYRKVETKEEKQKSYTNVKESVYL